MAMITKLAEEVLAMILTPSLTVPYSQLTTRYPRAFGGNELVPSSSTLLVCKRWLRVATPLLYETVVIRSTGQSYALAEALQLNPTFARYIKNVRLEGAYGGAYDILKHCRNLSTLVLFLNIYSESRITCLSRALLVIDPKHVFLFDSGGIDNVKFRKLLKTFCETVPTWKKLVTFGYPYSTMAGTARLKPDGRTKRSLLTDFLLQCPSLRVIYCYETGGHLDVHSLQSLAQIPSIMIKLVSEGPDDNSFYLNYKAQVMKDISTNKLLRASAFEFVSRAEQYVPCRLIMKKPQIFPVVDSSISFSNDTIMKVLDIVWADIFLLATTPSQETPIRECITLRGNLRLVSQKFSRVISFLSYTYPLIRTFTQLRHFINEVLRAPYLGNLVLEFSFDTTSSGDSKHEYIIDALCTLFPFLTSLRHLSISPFAHQGTLLMPSNVLAILAKAAGESLKSLRMDFIPCMPMMPSLLSKFKGLVHVNMSHACPFGTDPSGLGLDTLATLQELYLAGSSTFLNVLSVLRLPQLTVVVFSTSNPPVDAFMAACGAHVEELHFSGAANFVTLFRDTPMLRVLKWGPAIRKQRQFQDIITRYFNNFGAHQGLQKLRLVELPGYRCETEKSKVFKIIFDHLRLANFPSLRDIRFENYHWPDDERSIQRDPLPGIATALKREYGIVITDSTGKVWRPRVQKDRHVVVHTRA